MPWLGERKISGFWPWKNVEVFDRWVGLVMLKLFNFKAFGENLRNGFGGLGLRENIGQKEVSTARNANWFCWFLFLQNKIYDLERETLWGGGGGDTFEAETLFFIYVG